MKLSRGDAFCLCSRDSSDDNDQFFCKPKKFNWYKPLYRSVCLPVQYCYFKTFCQQLPTTVLPWFENIEFRDFWSKKFFFIIFFLMIFSIFYWKNEVSKCCSFGDRKNLKISNFNVYYVTEKFYYNWKINFFNVQATRWQIVTETSSHIVATYWLIKWQSKKRRLDFFEKFANFFWKIIAKFLP